MNPPIDLGADSQGLIERQCRNDIHGRRETVLELQRAENKPLNIRPRNVRLQGSWRRVGQLGERAGGKETGMSESQRLRVDENREVQLVETRDEVWFGRRVARVQNRAAHRCRYPIRTEVSEQLLH